jgi:voltage-gated potassium channel
MHVAEREVQPDKFGSIPDAMYWAIITLTTVGYGDAAPATAIGRLIAGITAITGLVMLSLPVGIIATSFAEVIHRRDFVVTWNMVARVPIFQGLDAADIAGVMRFLRSQMVDAGVVIVRQGDPAHSMFFIASGLVEIELPDQRPRLSDGHFFGQIAMIRRGRQLATVRALEKTRLLVLTHEDFMALADQSPDIGLRIRDLAMKRDHADGTALDGDFDMGRNSPDRSSA